jgi:hypothetical protein
MRAPGAATVAVVSGLVVGCSSTTRGTAGSDAGSDVTAGEGGACPDSEPAAGSLCSADEVDCPYACGTTYCSCTSSGFWACSVVLYGDCGACASVDGSPVPQEGAACGLACGPFVGDTCSFACPGSEGPVNAICETTGWHVLGSCSGGDADGS